MSDSKLTIEDILDAVMHEEKSPSHVALQRWCERFPEHRTELARFFATWAVQHAQEGNSTPDIDEAKMGSRMLSHALNFLHQHASLKIPSPRPAASDKQHKLVQAAGFSVEPASPANCSERLYNLISDAGLSEEAILDQCHLDDSLIAKLDRHIIPFVDVPKECIARLARAIGADMKRIALALMGPAQLAGSHKSKTKPEVRQESFLEAVASSDLSEERKTEWVQIISSERNA